MQTTCLTCGADLPEGARFCPQCGARVRSERPAFYPVTVVFVDLAGYTRLVHSRTLEEVAEITDRFFFDR